jgi:hypothetical protein
MLAIADGRSEAIKKQERDRQQRHRAKKAVTTPVTASTPTAAPGGSFDELKADFTKRINEAMAADAAARKLFTALHDDLEKAGLTAAQARELDAIREAAEEPFTEDRDEHPVNLFRRIIREDDKRRELTKQAKNPERALEAARDFEQRQDMDGDRDDAKQSAKDSGEAWGDIKDDWEAEWLADNWGEDREADFVAQFKAEWRASHGQDFPASDYATTKQKDAAHVSA